MAQPFISGLWVYPVKSCRGTAVREVTLTDRGFAFDREWMVADAEGRFITQRQEPRLALVEPTLTPTALQFRAPDLPALEIPLASAGNPVERRVTVWEFAGMALDEGNVAANWLGQFLGYSVRLVRWKPEERRPSDRAWTGDVVAENRFSDGYPILVLSEASLADLNARRAPALPLPMNRFRPNLVLGGVEAYEEDAHRLLRLGGVELGLVKPSVRCRITTTNQLTAAVDGDDPLRTLATYRRDARSNGVVFGQNAIVVRGVGGSLRVGMPVELV